MIIKSTFLATAIAASTLFFGGTTSSEAGPRISFQVSAGGHHGGYHQGHRGGYNRGYYAPPRRPVYHRGYDRGYRSNYRRPSYNRGGSCRY